MKPYTVTATLKFSGHGSAGRHNGYEVTVYAKTKAEAVSKARPMVARMGWDRHEGPLSYKAEERA
jgi:hypothetical protein